VPQPLGPLLGPDALAPSTRTTIPYHLRWQRIPTPGVDAATLFTALYAAQPYAFWLDSAKEQQPARCYSYMGDAAGPLAFVLRYHTTSATLSTLRCPSGGGGPETCATDILTSPFLDHVQGVLDGYQQVSASPLNANVPDTAYPSHFRGGLVGYLGYEMCNETLPRPVHGHPDARVPDAAFVFADRFLVVDHGTRDVWAVELMPAGAGADVPQESCWLREVQARVAALQHQAPPSRADVPSSPSPDPSLTLTLREDQEAYMRNIRKSLQLIREGETYEVCLTTAITGRTARPLDPLRLYHHLRRRNPAPYAAFLRFGADLAVCSSSPELFLSLTAGRVRMKPIKGTVPRVLGDAEQDEAARSALQQHPKDRAENLMIVDLIRNDLAHVCEPRSITVPVLMGTESYATVHQLVSTVEGTLAPGMGAVAALQHTLPPGSMTGAPKLRTVELLQGMEAGRRGIYSGVLGYLSLGGDATFNVVIRTVVVARDEGRVRLLLSPCITFSLLVLMPSHHRKHTYTHTAGNTEVSVGAGGAIVQQSEVEGEFEEMLLKANAVLPR
jgi:para-aminobenzoate synthetase